MHPLLRRRSVGSLWGSLVFGWAQMLSMWMGGAEYLPTPLFAGATAALWGWFAFVFLMDARAKRGQQAAPGVA